MTEEVFKLFPLILKNNFMKLETRYNIFIINDEKETNVEIVRKADNKKFFVVRDDFEFFLKILTKKREIQKKTGRNKRNI